MPSGFNVRVGDAEREAAAGQLREHYADGRLTLEELNERLDAAFAAKTRADLDAVLHDLPHVARPQPDPVPGPRAGWEHDTGNGSWQSRPRPSAAFAPLLGLVWLCVIIGSVFLFGIGAGERPLAIVLFIAALALLRRLLGLGRRRGYGGPRGPRGRRCRW
ncbi:MAG TPA: DUF1707 domain-containing protein [Streptosporangiaceae bacterium]|nr:DUF1707 domain-containing protein [Streptosporangiaceae bacterium]